MGFGLICTNGSSELTLSSDGMLFGYIGKATYVSTTAPGTSTTDSFSGYSTYTITWGAPIICAVGLVAGDSMHVSEVTNSGSTWTIKVFHGNGGTTTLGFDTQSGSTDVYVWGLPYSAPAWGMVLYDSSGNLTADLSRKPLTFDQHVSMASGVSSVSMSGYTKPAILGFASIDKVTSVNVGAHWENRVFDGTWLWDSGVNQLDRVLYQQEYFQDDGGVATSNNSYATDALLIEANGLT